MAAYAGSRRRPIVLVALLVCLIPTTIGALLSAIGIAGMDRLVRANVIALSGRSVEAAGDIGTLLLDKTGTITLGNRRATEFLPAPGVSSRTLRDAARLASLADLTPEGRSIVELALAQGADSGHSRPGSEVVEFTAQTRMSGVDLAGEPPDPQGCRLGGGGLAGADARSSETMVDGSPHRAARRWWWRRDGSAGDGRVLGVIAPEGRGQAGHRRAVRPAPGDGHPHRDDHRRQAATARPSPPRPASTTSWPRPPGGQDAADQGRAGRRPDGRDDRRRHQRRTGTGRRRCRGGDEHRHLGRQGGRQHDRPRLRPDQADRHRGDRQAAADHPRRADHLLRRQRHRQVLRDHPRPVRVDLSRSWPRST